MDERFDAEVAILGMGSAGLLTAVDLAKHLQEGGVSPDNILLAGRLSGGSSVLSSWYVAQYDPEPLKQRLINGLGEHPTEEQLKLVRYIADNHVAATERFKDEVIRNSNCGGVKIFEDGFSGIKALKGYSTRQSLPGAKVLRFLRSKVEELGVRKEVVTIDDLERIDGGYRISASRRGENLVLTARRLVIATGGMAHTKDVATSARAEIPNLLELARDRLNIQVMDLERAVFFPFALREDGYRPGCLLPPSFMTRADVIEETADGKRIDLLSDDLKAAVASGDYRPQFAELVQLFRTVRARGSKVLIETRMTPEEFEHYRQNDHYGYVFKDKTYEQALSVAVAPAYHSALGGIVVDSRCVTSDPSVFAVGESALVYGTDRPIGGEHVSAITLSPLIAEELAEQILAEQAMAKASLDSATGIERALAAGRTRLDRCDKVLVTKLAATVDVGIANDAANATNADVARFVRLVCERTSRRVNAPSLRRPLKALPDDSLTRILEDGREHAMADHCWSINRVVAAVDACPVEVRESILEAMAERLAVVGAIAPVKQRQQADIRDPARESQVVNQAMTCVPGVDAKGLVGGLYRNLLLPVAFELQRLYREAHPLAAARHDTPTRAHA